MTRCTGKAAMTLLLLALALPAQAEQYFLYSPAPVNPEELEQTKEGILAREIVIKKGDTLSGISRNFNGRGSYFPQILLFNNIKNPNLIRAGQTLRVPLAAKTVDTELSSGKVEPARGNRAKKQAARKRAGKHAKKQIRKSPQAEQPTPVLLEKAKPAAAASAAGKELPPVATRPDGQKLFDQAFKAYQRDDCAAAIELLGRFLANNGDSPLAADAALYRADCYLKLSDR